MNLMQIVRSKDYFQSDNRQSENDEGRLTRHFLLTFDEKYLFLLKPSCARSKQILCANARMVDISQNTLFKSL